MDQHLSPMSAVFLAYARQSLGFGENSLHRRITAEHLQWEIFPALARRHRLSGVVYQSLRGDMETAIPASVRHSLRQTFLSNTRQSLYLCRKLIDLLAQFQSAGVPVIPYKGPALGAAVYGNISLREFSDLDLLVPPQHALSAAELLLQEGYQPGNQSGPSFAEIMNNPREKDFTFFHPQKNVYLEMHYHLARNYQGFAMDTRRLFQRQQAAQLLDRRIPVLSPEDNLLVLCFNGTKDRWNRLSLVCDVAAQLKAAPELDWQYIWQQAATSGMTRRLLLGLSLAQSLLNAPLPREISQKIRHNRPVKKLQRQVFHWLFANEPIKRWGWQKNVFTIRSFDKKSHQFISARRFAREIFQVSEADREAARYSSWQRHFPLTGRFLRLSRKYLQSFCSP